jgi:sugar O-acyltransferase (sialic acid O-acetyltransferase NeuD family)
MTNHYVLAGAGGFGREVRAWLQTYSKDNLVRGFVDDVVAADHVLGTIAAHAVAVDARYLVCLGSGADRIAVGERLAARGARFGTLVAPMGNYATDVDGVPGGIFLGMCSISSTVSIGRFVLVQGFACVGHDVVLEDGVTVGSHTFIGGGAHIGRNATIHPQATILPRVRVGEGAVVGAGAVVMKDVPERVTVFGNPAKVIAVHNQAGVQGR